MQNPPVPNNNKAIVDMVIKDLQERKEFGLKKYGTVLQANNGRNALIDLYEEMLDGVQYLKQKLEEDNLLQKKLDIATKTLEFYADGRHFQMVSPQDCCGSSEIINDFGDKAKEALEDIDGL